MKTNSKIKVKGKREEKPIFIMIGENKDGEFEIIPESFFPVSNRDHQPVVIGVMIKGGLAIGDKLTLKNSSHIANCTVKELQVNHKEVPYVVKGEEIGILLGGVKIQKIRRINEARE